MLITPDKKQEYFDDTKLDNFKTFQQLIDEGWAKIIKQAEGKFNPKEKAGHINALKQLEVLTKNALVYGNTAPFDIHLQEWLVIRRDQVTPKTLEDGRLSIVKFKEDFPTVKMVKRRHVREWFDNQITVYSPDRLKKFKQHLQSYWTFLKEGMDHMLVDEDAEPFKGIHIKEIYNAEKQLNGWLPFPNLGDDLVRLLKGASTKEDQQLVNLIILDMYTGMRIEEACTLSVEHIDPDYIYVPKSKTTPEMRKIPIHSMLVEPLQLMVKESTDGYVISGLVSNNKYGIRSDPIGKRFGRLKSSLGFGPRYVFHSIKKTVTTIMEKADVRADVILDIIGHKNTSATDVASSMQKRKEAIEKLVYPLDYL
jgi:integrase